MNDRDLVTTKPVSFVTSTVPDPDTGKGVDAETGSSDSNSGVDDHEGAANAIVVVVPGEVDVVNGADVVVVARVVDGDVEVEVGNVVVDAAVVVDASVVVGVGVQESVIEPSLLPQPAFEYCGEVKPCDFVGLT